MVSPRTLRRKLQKKRKRKTYARCIQCGLRVVLTWTGKPG